MVVSEFSKTATTHIELNTSIQFKGFTDANYDYTQ